MNHIYKYDETTADASAFVIDSTPKDFSKTNAPLRENARVQNFFENLLTKIDLWCIIKTEKKAGYRIAVR